MTYEGEQVICIIYDAATNWPHSVFTRTKYGGTSCHDFDWCPHYEILAHHNSGGGGHPYVHRYRKPGAMKIWFAPGTPIFSDCGKRRVKRNMTRKLHKQGQWDHSGDWRKSRQLRPGTIRRRGYTILAHPIQRNGTGNPFDYHFGSSQECETVYCTVCGVTHIETDCGTPCDHLHWCDECGGWAGPGAGPDDAEDCTHTGDEEPDHDTEEAEAWATV